MSQPELSNNQFQPENICIETLDHHGITAGYCNKLKLAERIDARLPISKKHGAILNHGQRIKAMIINGLGFTQNPIYLTPNFFDDKALSVMFEEGIKATHLNDDALARSLDAAYEYGVTRLFAEIADEIYKEFMPTDNKQQIHLDTTSLKLCGEYDLEDKYQDDEDRPALPMYGHSKDHRPDLKQMMLSLTVSGPASLPIWFEGLDGNSSDKSNFHNTLKNIKNFRSALKNSPDITVVADSALYVKGKLDDAYYLWVTRVPETIKLVKQLVVTDESDFAWQELQDGYKGAWLGQEDRGLRQHWLLVSSSQACKRETITLNKRIEKVYLKVEKEADKLSKQEFACEKDALREAAAFEKKAQIPQGERKNNGCH